MSNVIIVLHHEGWLLVSLICVLLANCVIFLYDDRYLVAIRRYQTGKCPAFVKRIVFSYLALTLIGFGIFLWTLGK